MTKATGAGVAGDVDVAESTADVDGQPVHYLTAGDGERTLVLLHGGIIDAAAVSWGDCLGSLAADARVIAPDLPGYGASPAPPGPLSVPDHVDAVAGLLAELDVDGAVVAGLSMGGGVAVGLGLRIPERVSGVVAIDAFGLGAPLASGRLTWLLAKLQVTNRVSVALMRRSRRFTRAAVDALAHDGVSEAAIDRVIAEVRRPDAGAAFRKFRAGEVTWDGYRTDYTARLDELTTPVRFVHGRRDEVVPVECSERAAELAPDSDLSVLPECGHLPPLERPERTAELVTGAL